MLRVVAENQNEVPDAFRPWHVLTVLWGGLDTAAGNPMASSQGPTKYSMDDIPSWCNCNAQPISVPAHASLVAAVGDALDASNICHVGSECCNQQDWKAAFAPTATAPPPQRPPPLAAKPHGVWSL